MIIPTNGGPAFPIQSGEGPYIEGMSLLDYFAGKIAEGLVMGSLGRFDDWSLSAYRSGPCNHVVADRAYTLAEAMLAEKARRAQ